MKIITREGSKRYAIFLIISGIGGLWLSFWWYMVMNGDSGSLGHLPFSIRMNIITFYYLFNSMLLISSGILLLYRNLKIYSIVTIILGISVTASLFVFELHKGFNPLDSLFFNTIIEGMIWGFNYGGTVLVPMFLFSVYRSSIHGIKYFRKKIDYSQ